MKPNPYLLALTFNELKMVINRVNLYNLVDNMGIFSTRSAAD